MRVGNLLSFNALSAQSGSVSAGAARTVEVVSGLLIEGVSALVCGVVSDMVCSIKFGMLSSSVDILTCRAIGIEEGDDLVAGLGGRHADLVAAAQGQPISGSPG